MISVKCAVSTKLGYLVLNEQMNGEGIIPPKILQVREKKYVRFVVISSLNQV